MGLLKFKGRDGEFWVNPRFISGVAYIQDTDFTGIYVSGSDSPLVTISGAQDVADRISTALDKRQAIATYMLED